MNTIYDVDYFIRKFEAIPEELWCVGTYFDGDEKYCAHGHCGGHLDSRSAESEALGSIFIFGCVSGTSYEINDGKDQDYQQPTPKQRILAALRDIKAKQQPKEIVKVMVVDDRPLPERIVYVTVDKEVRELQKVLRDN